MALMEKSNLVVDASMEEIIDALLENALSLAERLQQENMSLAEAREQCQQYRDRFRAVCCKYALPYDNKIILCRELYKKLAKEKNDELKWLYCAVICDQGLLLDQSRKSRTEEQDILNYLDSSRALEQLWQLLSRKEKYKPQNFLQSKEFDKDSLKQSELFITAADVDEIVRIYERCIGITRDFHKEIFRENMIYISWKVNALEDLQKIAPLFFYQLIIKHKARITKSRNINPVISKLWKYKKYQIEYNNGKNYRILEQLAAFFISLCNHFFQKEKVDKNLTLYGFAYLSNICEWYYQVYQRKDLFSLSLQEWAAYDMYDLKQAEEFLPVPLSCILERLTFTGFETEYSMNMYRLYGLEDSFQEADDFYEDEFIADSKIINKTVKYLNEHEQQFAEFISSALLQFAEIPDLVSNIFNKLEISRTFTEIEENILLYSVHCLLRELVDEDLKDLLQDMERLLVY